MIAKVPKIDGLEKIYVVDSKNFVLEFKTDGKMRAFMESKGGKLIGRLFASPLHRFHCCLALKSEKSVAKVFKQLVGADYQKNV